MNLPPLSTAAEIVAGLRPGMTVFLPGVSGESLAFAAALQANPEAAAGLRFTGMHFPGINRSDYLGLHPQARQCSHVLSPGMRAGLADGRAELLAFDHPGMFRHLADHLVPDLALAQVAPPDADGVCSLGPAWDFHAAVWRNARRRVAHINPRLPRTRGSFTVRAEDFDAAFEADDEILSYDAGAPTEAMARHAALVAGLVRDGDTLEFGIGKLQAAVLAALAGHRRLRIWSGMISTPLLQLLDCGAIRGKASVQAGVALGDAAFYRRLDADPTFFFRPVGETHDVRRIARIRSFCAINSAVEVDLFGQVNADSVNGRLVAGVGGLPPFAAGVALSPGGRSIIALPAATDDGRHSRIVATLGGNGLTALPRHLADYIVTEHGVAALKGLTIHARARALIDIAAPAFREVLARQWDEAARAF